MVLNLAVNSRDAMPAGGMITIDTKNVVLDEDGPVQAGSYVQLTVSDTGEGMTPEVREQIFDPFFTTKPAGEGTGLGLATVYGIVNQSGGHVTAYSRPDLGSSFKVFLPASDRPLPTPEPAPTDAPAIPATETVLLVEDQSDREKARPGDPRAGRLHRPRGGVPGAGPRRPPASPARSTSS